ncbi:MAG TPA: class I SAM-dependent rRNA methyltransferase [Fibrobacteria bacterium]|nr:class I SAM-dependent rRNA methyltransferase [Fibrobacteria bacterium]HOX52324.1 class I SAM-dependent rRNA methyltransferase [Fibrobacteria bacterium]
MLPREERRVLAGHLWVFSNEVDWKRSTRPEPGESRLLQTANGRPLGLVDCHPHTLIAARLQPELPSPAPDASFWKERLRKAQSQRKTWVGSSTFCRLVNADGDRFPGLTIDLYGTHAVVQAQTVAMDQRAPVIAQALLELGFQGVKLSGKSHSRELEGLPQDDRWIGTPAEVAWVPVGEGVEAAAPIGAGQKTGFFLDQTENRRRLASFAAGRTVLDACSYTGGWGLAMAKAGAVGCDFLDADAAALEWVRQGWERADFRGNLGLLHGDVFDGLRQLAGQERRFGVVVLDPPAFAKSRKTVDQALIGYQNLARLGLEVLEPDGILVTCSCSGLVDEADFHQAVLRALRQKKRQARLLARLGAACDHPLHPSMPETLYLKVLVWSVD